MFSFLRAKLYLFGAGLLALLLGLLKIQSERAKSWKEKAKKAEKSIKFQEDVLESDQEIEQEFSHRSELAKEALKNDQIPEHLRKPRQ